jgi:hypothetical protein
MDDWARERLAQWLTGRVELAVGSLFLSSAARRADDRGRPPRPAPPLTGVRALSGGVDNRVAARDAA